MPVVDLDELPLTLPLGNGCTMVRIANEQSYAVLAKPYFQTFLRNESYLIRIHVTSGYKDVLYVPPHWHEIRDEFFHVIKGRLWVSIDGIGKVYVPEDGKINIPKGSVHSIRSFEGEEMIFEEGTNPMVNSFRLYCQYPLTVSLSFIKDGQKEFFFRNLLAEGQMALISPLQAMIVMYHGDTVAALPGHLKWLEKGLRALLGGYLAPLLGYKLKYDRHIAEDYLKRRV